MKLQCGPMPSVMAALPNIGGALCESSVIPFLVQHRKVWLTPAAGVNARLGRKSELCTGQNSAREQEPPKMYI